MGSSAAVKGRMPPRTNTTLIGDFFESATAKLLGCRVADYDEPLYADIYNTDLSFRVELKSRDDGHYFGLKQSQKEEYVQKNLPYPDSFNYTLYALEMYHREMEWVKKVKTKTGWANHYVSKLARLETEQEKCEYLARSWLNLYLLDIDIITALEHRYGLSQGSHPSHARDRGGKEIVIREEDLARMFCKKNFADTLCNLGLNPSEWQGAGRKVEFEFDFWTRSATDIYDGAECAYRTRFSFVSVLRREFSQQLLRQIDRFRAPSGNA